MTVHVLRMKFLIYLIFKYQKLRVPILAYHDIQQCNSPSDCMMKRLVHQEVNEI